MLTSARTYWQKAHPGKPCNVTQAMREYAASINASPLSRKTGTQYGRTTDAPLKKCRCGAFMHITESDRPDYESMLVCSECGAREYSDLSMADYLRAVSAAREEKDFADVDEIRAPYAIREQRRAICAACEHIKDGRCTACGCRIKHRTYYRILACPKDHWPAID
jgi:hypothetical protein